MRYRTNRSIAPVAALAALCTAPFTLGNVTAETLIRIRVIDDSGDTVRDAEAFLVDAIYGLPVTKSWTTVDTVGTIAIDSENRSRHMDDQPIEGDTLLIVRAPGFAWQTRTVALPVETTLEVTLDRGREVLLNVTTNNYRPLPDDLQPVLYTEQLGTATWITCVQGYANRTDHPEFIMAAATAQRRSDGMFIARVPTDFEDFSVLIDHPGFLRAFEFGPINVGGLTGEPLTIELPAPITIDATVTPSDDAPAHYTDCGVEILHSPASPSGWSFLVETRYAEGLELTTSFDDLAPGQFGVSGFTGTKQSHRVTERDDFCEIRRYATLAEGESEKIELKLFTWDETYWNDQLRGEYDVTINLRHAAGTPAAGKAYTVHYTLPELRREVELAHGTTDEDGVIRLDNVAPGSVAYFTVIVGGEFLDHIYLTEDEGTSRTYEYALAPVAGDVAPDFDMTTLVGDEPMRLSDLAGQVVFLEFWASWCGPCQEPMRHNDELLRRRADSWGDKVTILGVSIDNDIETIRRHVNERGWHAVKQVWVVGATRSDGATNYAVKSVPTAFLIDAKGLIVWTGHPTEIELETRIDELLGAD